MSKVVEAGPKKLWHVTVPIKVYVWAEDEDEAYLVAVRALQSDATSCLDSGGSEIEPVDESHWVEPDWFDGIPYGEQPAEYIDTTVGGILDQVFGDETADEEPAPAVDPNQLPLFDGEPLTAEEQQALMGSATERSTDRSKGDK